MTSALEPQRASTISAPARTLGPLPVLWIGIIAIMYFLQAVTPLRLNTDAVTFLRLAASYNDHHSFVIHGKPTHYPPGYPLLLATLERWGIADSASFVLVNCLFTGIAVAFGCMIAKRRFGYSVNQSLILAAAVLMSFPLIKHLTLPLSDIPFFGLNMLGFYLLLRAQSSQKWFKWWVSGMLVAVIAMTVRTIGVTLLAAGFFVLLPWESWRTALGANPKRLALGVIGLIVVIIIALAVVSHTSYWREMLNRYGQDGPRLIVARLLKWRLTEFGEMALNISHVKVPLRVAGILPAAGVPALILIFRGIYRAARNLSPLEIGTLCYVAILFVWPYETDSRFWIPLLPILIMYFLEGLPSLAAAPRQKLIVVITALFALIGLSSLAYSTKLSLAGDRFADSYGDRQTQSSYRVAFGRGTAEDRAMANADYVMVLQRFEKRAARNDVRP